MFEDNLTIVLHKLEHAELKLFNIMQAFSKKLCLDFIFRFNLYTRAYDQDGSKKSL